MIILAIWAWVAPWVWWILGGAVVLANCGLKLCGIAFLFDKGLNWWEGRS